MLYALSFLTGMRHGEAVGRRWRDWDESAMPLGAVSVATQYPQGSPGRLQGHRHSRAARARHAPHVHLARTPRRRAERCPRENHAQRGGRHRGPLHYIRLGPALRRGIVSAHLPRPSSSVLFATRWRVRDDFVAPQVITRNDLSRETNTPCFDGPFLRRGRDSNARTPLSTS